jgi:hypothetical protein
VKPAKLVLRKSHEFIWMLGMREFMDCVAWKVLLDHVQRKARGTFVPNQILK